MCGIFGLIKKNLYEHNVGSIYADLVTLLSLTSQRGAESSGFCFFNDKKQTIHKEYSHISEFIHSKDFKSSICKILDERNKITSFFGHTRLPVVGTKKILENTFPISTDHLLGIHNGNIIFDSLEFNGLEFSEKSDSRILFENLSNHFSSDEEIFEHYLISYLKSLKGDYSIAIYVKSKKLFYLTSNTGSLYYINSLDEENGCFTFMSENFFLKQFMKKTKLLSKNNNEIINIKNKLVKINNSYLVSQYDL